MRGAYSDIFLDHTLIDTMFGWTGIALSDQGICKIVLPKKRKQDIQKELESNINAIRDFRSKSPAQPSRLNKKERALLLRDASRLTQRYFCGERVLFDLPVDLSYYTAFQRAVWRATRRIPYGETRSYAWVAARIGKPNATRAVGRAMGANPVPIIVP